LNWTDAHSNFVQIPLWSDAASADTYENLEDAEGDIEQLAMFLLNGAIANQHTFGFADEDLVFADAYAPEVALEEPAREQEAAGAEAIAGDELESILENVNDFGTNNQEENVRRSDLAKSNGEFLFSSYGSLLITVDAETGEELGRTQIPPIEVPIGPSQGVGEEDEPIPEPGRPELAIDSMIAPPDFWVPTPQIDALLIEEDNLVVIASGYSSRVSPIEPVVLSDLNNTKLHLYKIRTKVDAGADILEHVATKALPGSFQEAFSMEGGSAFVVCSNWINTHTLFQGIGRWQDRFSGMNDDEYIKEATAIAQEELIPKFVDGFLYALEGMGGNVDLTMLTLYADAESLDEGAELIPGGIARKVASVVGFDMLDDDLTTSVTATIQPGNYGGHVYAHQNMIVVADQGWNQSSEMTYLMGFALKGTTASLSVVGNVPGSVLSPYSLDFVEVGEESYLRVATTQNFWSWGRPISDFEVDEEKEESRTKNRIFVLKFPSEDEKELAIVGEVTLGRPHERFTTLRFFHSFAYAVTFEQVDPFYVVDFENPESPEVKGELEVLGFSEYLHSITSDDKVLAAVGKAADETGRVTGIQISLFDARDTLNPSLLARLDVTDDSDSSWSYTSASWDPKAFRYLALGEGIGYLIMPLSSYTNPSEPVEIGEVKPEPESFVGFVGFSIDTTVPKEKMIQQVLSIDHASQVGFYFCSSFPDRSFVIDGNLVTMKSQSIKSTNLVSSEETWTVEMSAKDGCL